jgi:hypothetical protein
MLQTKLEEAQLRTSKCETDLDQTLKNAASKTLMLGQIKMATNNLFGLVNAHIKKTGKSSLTMDTFAQLQRIEMVIMDLDFIIQKTQSSVSSASAS